MSRATILAVVDTREQRPWALGPWCVVARRATLQAGDYSIVGLEDRVAVERKSKADFVGTIVQSWTRFQRELGRLESFDVAAVVVECDLAEILGGKYRSDAPPTLILDRMARAQVEHGIPVHFCGDRVASQRFADELLRRAWEHLTR